VDAEKVQDVPGIPDPSQQQLLKDGLGTSGSSNSYFTLRRPEVRVVKGSGHPSSGLYFFGVHLCGRQLRITERS
jgi:hypothetical protein